MERARDEAARRKLLEQLREELAELEEEKIFVLSQTGLHVSGGTVKKFEADLAALRERIRGVEDELRGDRS